MLRAGSPAYWVSRLIALPSVSRYIPGTSQRYLQMVPKTRLLTDIPLKPAPINTCQPTTHWLHPLASHPTNALAQEGESTMGLTYLNCCGGKSYSGPIPLTSDIQVNAVHRNGRHPSLVAKTEPTIWMMTCSTLTHPEDLKILIKEGIAKLCPPGIVAREYEAL